MVDLEQHQIVNDIHAHDSFDRELRRLADNFGVTRCRSVNHVKVRRNSVAGYKESTA